MERESEMRPLLDVARHAAAALTQAMSEIYHSWRDRLNGLQAAIARRDGQLGTLAAIGGRLTVLDCVSRPDAFAALHARLVAGYALNALEHDDCAPPPRAAAEASWTSPTLRAAIEPCRSASHSPAGSSRARRPTSGDGVSHSAKSSSGVRSGCGSACSEISSAR